MDVAEVRHSTVKVGPVTVFYREAGLEGRPVLLLLHGFANSSHYFRHLMPLLANRFHLIAPDLPSFGFTKVDGEVYRYTFAQLTETTQAFVDGSIPPSGHQLSRCGRLLSIAMGALRGQGRWLSVPTSRCGSKPRHTGASLSTSS